MECASGALAARRHKLVLARHAEHAIAIARVTGFALVGGTVSGLCGWVGCMGQRHVNFRDCKFKYYLLRNKWFVSGPT